MFRGRVGGELVISHLLYADDTVLFCEANSEQMFGIPQGRKGVGP